MCIFYSICHSACGCVIYRLDEAKTCSARPYSSVNAIYAASTSVGSPTPINLQRRFNSALNEPQKQIISRLPVTSPAGPSTSFVPQNTESYPTGFVRDHIQFCLQSKLDTGKIEHVQGQCQKCILGKAHPRMPGRDLMFHKGEEVVRKELVPEFGHFNEIDAEEIEGTVKYQEELARHRRTKSFKQEVSTQRAEIVSKLLASQQPAPAQQPNAYHNSLIQPRPKSDPAPPKVAWSDWLKDEHVTEEQKEEAEDDGGYLGTARNFMPIWRGLGRSREQRYNNP